MSDYEKDQANLQKLLNEFLPDDEPEPFSARFSEEFFPSSDSDSSSFEQVPRKKLFIDEALPQHIATETNRYASQTIFGVVNKS
ncbi:hypothetical protein QE152_g37198 [Popillia japonica]|uniref:Uncharacterized protein n=1 Tax=Popillia japonica TaxID=7064 RepID=A0AAW1IBJ7_POPJA